MECTDFQWLWLSSSSSEIKTDLIEKLIMLHGHICVSMQNTNCKTTSLVYKVSMLVNHSQSTEMCHSVWVFFPILRHKLFWFHYQTMITEVIIILSYYTFQMANWKRDFLWNVPNCCHCLTVTWALASGWGEYFDQICNIMIHESLPTIIYK